MLFIHSMRSATSIFRQLHTLESSVKHFLPEPRFCMLVERFPRIFCQHGSLFTAYVRTFFHVILLFIFSSSEPSPQLYSNFLFHADFTFSHLPTSSTVELTQREQQMQSEYQLGSGPGDTSWKEGRLFISRNYVSVEEGAGIQSHCSLLPFAPRNYIDHHQNLNINRHSMFSSTFT